MSFRTAYGHTSSENGWRMVNRDECVTVACHSDLARTLGPRRAS